MRRPGQQYAAPDNDRVSVTRTKASIAKCSSTRSIPLFGIIMVARTGFHARKTERVGKPVDERSEARKWPGTARIDRLIPTRNMSYPFQPLLPASSNSQLRSKEKKRRRIAAVKGRRMITQVVVTTGRLTGIWRAAALGCLPPTRLPFLRKLTRVRARCYVAECAIDWNMVLLGPSPGQGFRGERAPGGLR
ncbi:MAG: hypothetical protein JWR80_643 [Bradyrhizobium sp.]|nr:hypothetical protein [Bradyrhizobium sp.]